MGFIKQQQAKAREASSVAIQLGVAYLKTEELDQIIAQTIKDTTARVRKVMGEELPLEVGWDDSWAHGNNALHRKVTQELNSLEDETIINKAINN